VKLRLHGPTEIEATEIDGGPHLHFEGDAGGEGFGPLQMFAASLALCAVSVLAAYDANVLHVGTARLSVRLRWHYDEHDGRVARMETAITWPELPENRIDAVRRAADSCTVHRTLEHPPVLETTVSRG
jgi:uncharacterized OsmC-like protein